MEGSDEPLPDGVAVIGPSVPLPDTEQVSRADDELLRLVTALRARTVGGASAVLADDAIDDVIALLRHAPEVVTDDADATGVIADLYWTRLVAGVPPQELGVAAAWLYAARYRRAPETVPPEVRRYLGQVERGELFTYGWLPPYSIAQAGVLRAHFERTGGVETLGMVITVLHRATQGLMDLSVYRQLGDAVLRYLRLTGRTPPLSYIGGDRGAFSSEDPDLLGIYATALLIVADQNEDAEAADAGIRIARDAVRRGGARPRDLGTLAMLLRSRHRIRRDLDALNEAVRVMRTVVAQDRDAPGHLHNFAVLLNMVFQETGDRVALEEAAQAFHRAAAAFPAGPREASLTGAADAMYQLTQDRADLLDAALDAHAKALRECTSPRNEVRLLATNGALLERRYERDHDVADLDTILADFRRIFGAIPEDDVSLRGLVLVTRASTLMRRFRDLSDESALDDAIATLWEAVELSSTDSEHFSNGIRLLGDVAGEVGGSPHWTSQRGGELERMLRKALTKTRDRLLGVQIRLRLCRLLDERYELTRDTSFVDEAARLAAEAQREARLLDADVLLQADATVAELLATGGKAATAPKNVERSIALWRSVLDRAGPEHRMWPIWTGRLGLALYRRHELTAEMGALDEAVSLLRAARKSIAPNQSWVLDSNLSLALMKRSERTGERASVREAVDLIRGCGDEKTFRRCWLLNNLAVTLSRNRDPEFADDAVAAADQAIALALPDDPLLPAYRSNRAIVLRTRCELLGDADDARASIEELRSLSAGPFTVLTAERVWRQLAESLLMLAMHEQGESGAELFNEALSLQWAALDRIPPGHPDRGAALLELSNLLGVVTRPEYVAEHASALAEAVADTSLPPRYRYRPAFLLGRILADQGSWSAAGDKLAEAVLLLPQTASRRLTPADHERLMAGVSGLASDAAACALNAGQPERAVELFEQGRGVLLSNVLDTRADTDAVAQVDADLAERYDRLREQMHVRYDDTDRQHVLAAQWESLLADIRALPGMDGFLRPPRLAELLVVADRPVVALSVSEYRCDAMLLTSAGLEVVPLPVSHARCVDMAEKCAWAQRVLADPSAAASDRWQAAALLPEVLEVLAEKVVGPVLDALGNPSSVCWVPAGPLAVLPLHAAALDRVVSSYAPTIRMMTPAPRADGPALAVAVPSAPGVPDLPMALREADSVAARFGGRTLAGATRADVLELLPAHPIAHFACHAVSDPVTPSASKLVLADGEVTVADIIGLHVPGARLAFLSACATAQVSIRLADEVVHMCAAFRLAGYADVVGTLWPVADDVAHDVADSFYRRLAAEPSTPIASLVNATSRELRDRYPRSPWLWAGYIHMGS